MKSFDREDEKEEKKEKEEKEEEEKEEIAMLKPSQLRNNPLFNRLNFGPMNQSRPREPEKKTTQEENREDRQEVMPNLHKSFAPPRHPTHYST